MKVHVVREGDCLASIAFENGFSIMALWDLPENAALKEQRTNPHTLVPGDRVMIPDRSLTARACETTRTHTFRRRDVPEKLRMRFLDEKGKPRAGVSYTLTIEHAEHVGTLDADGRLEHWIPPNAQRGTLEVEGLPGQELFLGRLRPVTDPAGVRARLCALGFLPDADEEDVALVAHAIRSFQRSRALHDTGVVDDDTRAALLDAYGS